MFLALFHILFFKPIYVDFYFADFSDSTVMDRAALNGVNLVRRETKLNIVIKNTYRAHFSAYDFMRSYQLGRRDPSELSVLIKYGTPPHGFAEVCGSRAVVFLPLVNHPNTFIGTMQVKGGLVKHEILHMLGASHYKGFINTATARVMHSIRKCLRLKNAEENL